MSNCLVNIRFGEWHFQIVRDRPWVSLGHNPYHAIQRRHDPKWRWFEVYDLLGWRS
ncbi:hypothetical protein C7441_11097 [Pseudaminobacter salicylatoxidans]|uniref:Uncharacterized protein n=1 Tax=Pseudaminobacter salicylatoxidans TaxID=93369 RepID=A0A316CMA0_PSESE|nr:hypothetical protein C7441_11097 [Pseudaminobacter salicylatoxidans]